MFKFLRKGLEKLGILKPTQPVRQEPPVRRRPAPSVKITTRPPVPQTSNQRVIRYLKRALPYPKERTLDYNVHRMTDMEKRWTLAASGDDIRHMGSAQNFGDLENRLDAVYDDPSQIDEDNYYDDGEFKNPWWYK